MSDAELFTPAEAGLLTETLQLRQKAIRELTENEKLPCGVEDRAFLLHNLKGIEDVVLKTAGLRIRKRENETALQENQLMQDVLNALAQNKSKRSQRIGPPKPLAPELSAVTLVPGETDINPPPLNPDEVLGKPVVTPPKKVR